MKPAFSLVLFTTIAGAAQGVGVVLAAATLAGSAPTVALPMMLWVVTAMLLTALAASFFHLGHPLRAWRAVLMWRTSWMSREVILLPVFICIIGAWAVSATVGRSETGTTVLLAWLTIAGAFMLWYCTAMIYVCIRFIQEWAHPLTIINFATLGMASGLLTSGALAMHTGDGEFAVGIAPWAVGATAVAWFTRSLSLRRNTRLKLKSTIQSATGIRSARVVQQSMGFTGGSFNTREFFHGASMGMIRMVKVGFQVLAFAIPILLLLWGRTSDSSAPWTAAFLFHAAGLVAERWFFFAQARHPQNLYYQVVS